MTAKDWLISRFAVIAVCAAGFGCAVPGAGTVRAQSANPPTAGTIVRDLRDTGELRPVRFAQYSPYGGKPLPGSRPQGTAAYPQTNRSAEPYTAVPPANSVYLPEVNQLPPANGYAGNSTTALPSPLPAPGATFNPPSSGPAANGSFLQPFPDASQVPVIPEPPDRFIDLDVYAQEVQTGRFSVGVAVNSDAGLTGSVVIDERNFDWRRWPRSFEDIRNGTAWRGAGQRFRLEAFPGTIVRRYSASFQEPYLFDSPVSFGLTGFFYNRRFDDWDEERLGGRTSLGYQFTHDLSGTIALRTERINIFEPTMPAPPELTAALGDSEAYSLTWQLAHDTRDSAFLATEGHFVELSYEQVFGSFDYPRVVFDARQYFMLRERVDGSGRHVVSVTGKAGVSGSQTPIYDRFFAGGFSSMRGFDFRGASPRNLGVTVGGEMMLLGSVEYMFPITADDMVRAVVFCDFGTVEESISVDTEDFRVAPGFGIRIAIPALGPAPIALDLAFPVATEDGDDIQNLSFFVGYLR